MKLLVDQNLPQRAASLLEAEGYIAEHTQDVGLETAADPKILSWCCTQARVLITADKKLTKFLATPTADCPSVVVTRELRVLPLEHVVATLIANLGQIENVITERGNAVFSLAPGRPIRVELLPLGLTTKPT